MQIEQKIYEILHQILEVPVDENTHLRMQECASWTSLAHIDLIMSLEEEFGITFNQEDLPFLTSQDILIEKVRELL